MLNISETVRDRGLVPNDYQQVWHMGHQMVTSPMASRDPQRCCEAVFGYLSDNLAYCLTQGSVATRLMIRRYRVASEGRSVVPR